MGGVFEPLQLSSNSLGRIAKSPRNLKKRFPLAGRRRRLMINNYFFYLFITLLFFGIGDFLGVLTKAKVSSVFVSLLLFLVCFMTGIIPADTIKLAGLSEIGSWSALFIIFSMGTSINLREFISEWRTVVTAVLSMLVVMASAVIMIPLVGYNETIVSVPIINGGIVATQIMTTAAMEKGLTLAAALGTIVYAVQKFFGTPFASYFGIREARWVVEELRRTGKAPVLPGAAAPEDSKAKGPNFFERHKKYYGNFVSLAICGLFAWFAFMLGKLTGLSATIWALILGTVVCATGTVPKNILKHSNSSGIFNVAIFATIIPSLAKIRFEDLFVLGYATIVLFVITFAVLLLCFYVLPLWKILGSRNLALGVAAGQLLGFPATYLIVNEITNAVGETDAERQAINDHLMPKYLVSGFATVTSISVIIAGFCQAYLQP